MIARAGERTLARIHVRPAQVGVPFVVPLAASKGVCNVTFTVTPTAVPATVLQNGDTRVLGIRMQDITYRPG